MKVAIKLFHSLGVLLTSPVAVFAVLSVCLVVPLYSCGGSGCGGADTKTSGRHVILITLDTVRADHLGCYGSTVTKTPNIDRLAGDGVLFEDCFSTAPNTLPSHASILTSLYIKDHKVPANKYRLADNPVTLPNLMKANGILTAAFTSVPHLGIESGFNQGFDHFYCYPMHESSAEETNEKVFDWLDDNRCSDFFLWVHYFDAHMPYIPHEGYTGKYDPGSRPPEKFEVSDRLEKEFKDYFEQSDDAGYYRNLYSGEINYLDAQVGKLMDKLSELGIYDDSMIVVVADHGEFLGEHGIYFDHDGLYNEVTHVPLIIKFGGEKYRGRRPQPVSSVDIYPTITDVMGITHIKEISGKSLVGMAADPESPPTHPVQYYQHGYRKVGVRDHRYSFISQTKVLKEPGGACELYDNISDPAQLDNVSGGKPEEDELMRLRAVDFLKDTKGIFGKPIIVEDPGFLEKLKSLGYAM